MGDPKKQHRKFLRPSHPWEKDRIAAENKLLARYGLRRKEEIWKVETVLRGFRRNARRLLTASGSQAELETKQMLGRLRRLGLVKGDATLDNVLGLTVENVLDRRLQTLVYKKGMAKTPLQARQLVLHGHITVRGKRMTVPSYLVGVAEEAEIQCIGGVPVEAQPQPEVPPAAAEAGGAGEQVAEQAEPKEE